MNGICGAQESNQLWHVIAVPRYAIEFRELLRKEACWCKV